MKPFELARFPTKTYVISVAVRPDQPFEFFFHRKPFSRILWDLQLGWVEICRINYGG